jgi:hypothetical protein
MFEPDFSLMFDIDTFKTALLVLLYSVVIRGAAMLLVCIPLTLISSALAIERSWIYSVFGLLTGCAVALAFSDRPLALSDWLDVAIIGGLPGMVAGQIWWLTYRRLASSDEHA